MPSEQFKAIVELMRSYRGDDTGLEWFDRIIDRTLSDTPRPRERWPIDTFNFGPRRDVMELRPRHLLFVEELGVAENFDRDAVREWMLANYNFLFGAIRYRKADEVPSDSLRKLIMITRLLNMVETRRDEYPQFDRSPLIG